MFEGNASYLYIANAARGTDTIEGMANNSVAIVNEAGTVLTGATTTGLARVAAKLSNGEVVYSPFFDMATRKNLVGKSYVAPTTQLTYLGYNGTSGAMDATADATFVLNVEWKNSQFAFNNTSMMFSAPYHTTAASQYELATGLVAALDGVMERQPYEFIKTERINNAAVTTANAFDNDATVVSGVNAFTVATNLQYNAGGGTLAVGDFVRFGTVGSGTALTDGVYKVTAIDSLQVTLDRTIKAASGTYATATDDLEVIPAGSIGANWGLKFQGVNNSTFNKVNDTYAPVRFDIISDDFSTATVTYSTEATEGSGSGQLVANMETYSEFLDKHSVISAYPERPRREQAVLTNTYDLITFESSDAVFTSPTTGMTTTNSFRIQIATEVSLAGDDIDTVFGVTV